MADIYVVVKSAKANASKTKDVKKAAEIATNAAVKALKETSGVTGAAPGKGDKKKKGYAVRLVVASAQLDARKKEVSCKVTGELLTWPEERMVSTSLTGTTTFRNETKKEAIAECVAEAVKYVITKKVAPTVKKLATK